jgi:hypothetical protein
MATYRRRIGVAALHLGDTGCRRNKMLSRHELEQVYIVAGKRTWASLTMQKDEGLAHKLTKRESGAQVGNLRRTMRCLLPSEVWKDGL